MNLRRLLTVLCVPLIGGAVVAAPAEAATAVTVKPDPAYRQQPFDGWGASLAWIYLRIVGRTSLFPVRDPRLIESLKLVN